MNWTFYIDSLEIDEPIGFADLTLRAKRDELWHGIFFEATTSDLRFYGAAADYLRDKKEQQGFAADVTFRAVTDCGGTDEVFRGKLDFRKYQISCGNECIVTLPVEQEGCIMTLRNRYDQKVDTNNRIAFDGVTILPDYNGMNFEMELAAQETRAAVEGYVEEADVIDLSIFPPGTENFDVRPTYLRKVHENINQGQLLPTVFAASDNGLSDPVLSPVLLLDEEVDCFDGEFDYEIRMKGSYDYAFTGIGDITEVKLMVAIGEYPSSLTVLHTQALSFSGDTANGTFDYTFTGNTPLAQGDGFYAYFENNGSYIGGAVTGTVTFDPETYVNLNANRVCPATNAEVSLVHELASFITEAITDQCLKVKSDYYGRTDSEPYAPTEDGCGSLRVLTSGLKIRRAENPKHFISLRDLFDGLNAIDNIGIGVEDTWLRMEPVEYFYQDVKILDMPYVPKGVFALQESMAYSMIKVGYKKWETEETLGLDEFNSNKEFRTTLSTINNTLDITSGFVAAGYVIEDIRQQSFSSTGQADTKYDNDTFIICVVREPYAYGNDYSVEQGNIINAANFYSPSTAYNWRIRPMYNLMRWWKSIAQSYTNLVNSASKLLFSAGTGNLLAEGNLAGYDPCRVDATLKPENGNLANTDLFTGEAPIWKPETMNFIYPMSLKDYNLIKAQPYGYLNIQCGTGEYQKGFITNLLYRIGKGEVDVTVKMKWPTA